MLAPHPFQFFANPNAGTPGLVVLPTGGFRRAKAEIMSWPGYAPTPLLDLPDIARAAGVGTVRLKDEAGRFGLGSFKALGGAYAVLNLLRDDLSRRGLVAAVRSADLLEGEWREQTRTITVTSATDGNHGRSVAWAAQRFGCRAVIFVHAAVSQSRIDAIAAYGAEIRVVAGTYDDAVRECGRTAQAEGWLVVSDTSWPGYTEIPRDVMQGYRLMADEALDQWAAPDQQEMDQRAMDQREPPQPTHVFMQGGVGGAAAAVSVHMRLRISPCPMLVVVEPERAACLLASAEAGGLTSVPGGLDTIMAGLACGEPSLLAWQELERGAAAFMAIPDAAAIDCMRLLAADGIVSGESGVAGLAGFLLAAADPAAREVLGLSETSRVLLFSTEGATDPRIYEKLIGPDANKSSIG
jgi:diaminopropionate ammonia-lyase